MKKSLTEQERIRKMIDDARPPAGCSPNIPVSPARGAMQIFAPMESYLTDNGPRQRPAYDRDLGAAVRVASPLDLIELKASGRSANKGPVFDKAQHIAAGEYEALFERVNSGRVKCSSMDVGMGGGAGSFMDTLINDIQRLRRMDSAIGAAFFHEGTGSVPVLAARGATAQPGRRSIWIATLVHSALIRHDPLKSILERHGWAVQTRYRKRLQMGLATALNAISGL
ncbi:hypothetical protein [Pseudooceanicola sp.]|uniref:hypothetical protein n=1 Tax=Pseudooceanicola sp. TaxID=1914328 RepID=UPI0035146821